MKKRQLKKITKRMLSYIYFLHNTNKEKEGAVYITGGQARVLMRGLNRLNGFLGMPTVFNFSENYNVKRWYIFSIVDNGFSDQQAMVFNPFYLDQDCDIFNSLYLDHSNQDYDDYE